MPEEIVGRGIELAAVERLWTGATRSFAALVLEGEAGIGKTTLWESALAAARARGWLVLVSRPVRSEQGLTLGGLSDVFAGLDDGALAGLPEPQRHALEVALLRVAPSGTLPDQRALSVAVAGLLRSLTSPERPVLLALDDAQWLDESSAAIFAYAIRRLADRPLGLVVSVRAGSATPASDGLVAAAPVDRLERIAVGPLPLGSLHRLFQVRLGRSFPRLVLVRIEAASGGNPLYALEIARALQRSGAPVTLGEPLPVPESLGSLIAGRVSAAGPHPPRAPPGRGGRGPHPRVAEGGRRRPAGPGPGDRGWDRDARRGRRPIHPPPARPGGGDARCVDRAPDGPCDARRRDPLARRAGAPSGRAAVAPDEAVAMALGGRCGGAVPRGDARRGRPVPGVGPPDARRSGRFAASAGQWPRRSACSSTSRRSSRRMRSSRTPFASARARTDARRCDEPAGAHPLLPGRAPEAIELGRQALDEVGDDPILRAKVLGRVAFLSMQLDLERGVALVDEAARLLEGAPTGRPTPTCSPTSSCCVRSASLASCARRVPGTSGAASGS